MQDGNRSGEKRPLDDTGGGSTPDGVSESPQPKRQRPALASVAIEAIRMEHLNKICSSLEPLLRRVIGEEVEKALAKMAPASVPRLQPKSEQVRALPGPGEKKLRLQFRSKLALPLFTGAKVEGEGGQALLVVLQDAETGQLVTRGAEANLKLEAVVLEGDFNTDDRDEWSEDVFESNMVRERDGKRALLSGDVLFSLRDGVGTVGEVMFTDNSSWIRSRKFRLGVRVAEGQQELVPLRIREAKTEPFTVKDHRGELYKKHYPPSLTDEIWRLDRIGKDGAFHKRLNQAGIFSVEDFLRLVVMDPQKLRNILGSGMSNKMWENVVDHAKTCFLDGKLHVYYADERQNIGVIFNNIYQLMGLIADSHFMSVDQLSESEKLYVDRLVKVAYENWENVVEYEGHALSLTGIRASTTAGQSIDGPQRGSSSSNPAALPAAAGSQAELDRRPAGAGSREEGEAEREGAAGGVAAAAAEEEEESQEASALPSSDLALHPSSLQYQFAMHQHTSSQQQAAKEDPSEPLPHLSHHSLPSAPPTAATLERQPIPPALANEHVPDQHLDAHRSDQGLALAHAFLSGSDSLDFWPGLRGRESVGGMGGVEGDDFHMSEEELRAQSMQILQNEEMNQEMQQLLGLLGDHPNLPFSNPSFASFADDSELLYRAPFMSLLSEQRAEQPTTQRSSGSKVGWLKLKAALRWGIFIRKRAAQRRAGVQLQEIHD